MAWFGTRYKIDSTVFIQVVKRENPLDCTFGKVLNIQKGPDKRTMYLCKQLYPIIAQGNFMGWFAGASADSAMEFWCYAEELHKKQPEGVKLKYKNL